MADKPTGSRRTGAVAKRGGYTPRASQSRLSSHHRRGRRRGSQARDRQGVEVSRRGPQQQNGTLPQPVIAAQLGKAPR